MVRRGAFVPRKKGGGTEYRRMGGYLVPQRLVELERKNSITVDEYREILIERQERILDHSDTIDGWPVGVYDLPFAELIPLDEIREQHRDCSGRQARLGDVVWCYFTAMTIEMPSWRVDQLLHCEDEMFRPHEAMMVYEAAQGLMEDCGIC